MTNVAERFWSKVDIGDPDECWEWQGGCFACGYGTFHMDTPKRRMYLAHRVAWEFENGPVPKGDTYHGTCVCHSCDNRRCVNPSHLFLGTHADNMADMKAKDRARSGNVRGEQHGMAKLTAEDVLAIRKEWEDWSPYGLSQRELARIWGVSFQRASSIINRTSWRHI